jgi:shikimate 5-dehydrogenase
LKRKVPVVPAKTPGTDQAWRVMLRVPSTVAGSVGTHEVSRIAPGTFVGEVVMRTEMTAFLNAAQLRGCPVQVGSDMLFEQIPAYLEYFNLPTTTPDALRAVARLQY